MQQPVMFKVEVAYATTERQYILPLQVPYGTSAMQAIKLSGILEFCPEINVSKIVIGIYSRPIEPGTLLQDQDRVEIYRPLKIDPKQKRIIRAKLQK